MIHSHFIYQPNEAIIRMFLQPSDCDYTLHKLVLPFTSGLTGVILLISSVQPWRSNFMVAPSD